MLEYCRIKASEINYEKGKQRESQIDFETTVKKLGFEYFVVRDLSDFKLIIENKFNQ